MKKGLLSVSLISLLSLVALTGCNNGGNESTTSSEGVVSSSEEVKLEALENFLEATLDANGTVEDSEFVKHEYLGAHKGFVNTFLGEYVDYGTTGYINIEDYGTYEIEIVDEEVFEVEFVYPVEIDYTEQSYTVFDIGYFGAEATWVVNEDGSFTTDDEDLAFVFAYMDGLSSFFYDFSEFEVTLDIDNDGDAVATIILGGSAKYDDYEFALDVYDIGATENAAVEAYLASDPTFAPLPGFSDDFIEELEYETDTTFGTDTLPFPNGITYAASESLFMMGLIDYKSGDLSTTYAAQLEEAGFTLDKDLSDLAGEDYGYIDYVYSKEVGEEDEKFYAPKLYVEFYFYSTDLMSKDTAALYPYGEFMVFAWGEHEKKPELLDEYELDARISSVTLPGDDIQNAYPAIDLGGKATKIEYLDLTEKYQALYGQWGYIEDFVASVKIYIEDEEDALSIAGAYGEALVDAGFEYDEYWDSYDIYLDVEDGEDFLEYDVSVDFEVAYDYLTGEYLGYITFNFEIYA